MKKFFQISAPPQITLFLIIFNSFFTANLFVSCMQEAKDVSGLPDGKTFASERGGCDLGECAFTIEALNNCTVEACGDINPSISGCNFGCNTLTNDRYNVTVMALLDQVVYCVPMNGSICLRNSSTATSDAQMNVYFEGTTTPVYVEIPPGEMRCFHTNSSCATIGGCF
jgi:hypothetical protein